MPTDAPRPAATLEPSESAFTGRLCVIGMGAVAPLTGDDHAGKACHPCRDRRAQLCKRGRVAEMPESV